MTEAFNGEPLPVSFRDLVGPIGADLNTAGLYPYPARILRQIPRFLILALREIDPEYRVLDPFCGSGTVLLEAQLAGLSSLGIDTNPIAALISRVKTRHLPESDLIEAGAEASARAKNRSRTALPAAFLARWHSPSATSALTKLRAVIIQQSDSPERDALLMALALTIRQTSIMDTRIPVPVVSTLKAQHPPTGREVWSRFNTNVARLAARVDSLPSGMHGEIVSGDARTADAYRLAQSPAARWCMITSPPYGAAQKYPRSTGLEAAWLGYTDGRGVAEIESRTIGREHIRRQHTSPAAVAFRSTELREVLDRVDAASPSRGAIYRTYFTDMHTWASQVCASVRGLDRIYLVAGTNIAAGQLIPTHKFLAEMLEDHGFATKLVMMDAIRGRTLLTRRHRGSHPAPAEYIYVMERR